MRKTKAQKGHCLSCMRYWPAILNHCTGCGRLAPTQENAEERKTRLLGEIGPELLEALKRLIAHIDGTWDGGGDPEDAVRIDALFAKAAIQRAEGKV